MTRASSLPPPSASPHEPVPVRLATHGDRPTSGDAAGLWSALLAEAQAGAGDPVAGLALAARWGPVVPLPGSGSTTARWEVLAGLGAVDLTVARAVEPHLDALAILAEADLALGDERATWAVWAAEGPGVRVSARAHDDPGTRSGEGGGHRLDGVKPWCSLAGEVSHALVTAWIDETRRSLFAVSLDDPGAAVLPAPWVSRGLPRVRSGPVGLADVVATEVGGPDWYLRRPGFAWGGIGVAAVWYGAAVAVARRLWRQAGERRLDQVGEAALGEVDAALWGARSVLHEAALAVDAGHADGETGAVWALRVRQVVVDAAEQVLAVAVRSLGPGPLTAEEPYAAVVADLQVYVRQHHGARDRAALARGLLGAAPSSGGAPW